MSGNSRGDKGASLSRRDRAGWRGTQAARSRDGRPVSGGARPLPPELSSFLAAYNRFLQKRAEYIVVAILLVTAAFIPVLQQTSFDTDLDKFLPDDPVIEEASHVEAYFGADPEPQYFIFTGPNVISPRALREELNVTLQAAYVEGVVESYSLAGVLDELARWQYIDGNWTRDPARSILVLPDGDVEGLRSLAFSVLDPGFNLSAADIPLPGGLDLADVRLLLASLMPGDFRRNDTGARTTVAVVAINGSWPDERLKDAAVLIEKRVGALHLTEVSVSMTSTSLLTREVDEATLRDNVPIAVGIFLLIAAIIGLSFRRASYIALPMASLMIAGIWTFGAARLMGVQLMAIDIAVVPLIIGLGIDYFVHVSIRYQEELRTQPSPDRAMGAALTGLFSPMALAVLTTMAAFLTNVFTGIQPIREFGLLCALGVGSCALLAVTFYPASRLLLDRRSKNPRVRTLRDVRLFTRGMSFGAQGVSRYPGVVIIIVVVITAGAFVGALNLRTEFGVEDFVQAGWPAMKAINEMRDGFPAASMYQSWVLVEGDVATPSKLQDIFDIQKAAQNDRYTVRSSVGDREIPKVDSAASLICRALEQDPSLGTRFNVSASGPLPGCTAVQVVSLYDYLSANATYEGAFSRVVHRDARTGRYDAALIRVHNFVRDTAEGRRMYAELEEDARGRGTVTGGAVLTIRTLDAFRESQISSTAVSVVFAAVFLVVVYRRWALGLLSILPVAVSALWVMGTMFVLSISLNALTLTVTALTIGLGIDYTIYITQRFREELRGQRPAEAMRRSIESTGVPIFLCALTTWAGFGVLTLSPMPLTQQFGIITAATIAYSFILGLFFFPLFLLGLSKMKRAI
jgi:predicted RND superfamily exporter protein